MNKRIAKIFFIILLMVIFYLIANQNINYKYSLIEMRNSYSNIKFSNNYIDSHFIVLHVKNRYNYNISPSAYYIEHNINYDDILFLIPLYNLLVKSKIIVICNNSKRNRMSSIKLFRIRSYTTYKNCIYIERTYLKYLHLHTKIFRFCKFDNVYNIFKKKKILFNNISVCQNEKYSTNFSIVTTVYRRNNLKNQINTFLNQLVPPQHIIVVHDRNIINVPYDNYDILYIHTINFEAGFYFRYLLSLLSPENDIIIYDDDWFPSNRLSHIEWINKMQKGGKEIYGHHSGIANNIKWCATPLIIHRKWLYLIWYIKIYEIKGAEDGHTSFSLLLLCNIKCKQQTIIELKYKHDNLSSTKNFNVSKSFWQDYTMDVKKKNNSMYLYDIKNKYHIY